MERSVGFIVAGDVGYATTLGTWTNSAAASKLIGDPRYALIVFRSRLR